MSNIVENPILNSAFEEPTQYHYFAPGQEPEVRDGRRSAQYLMARRNRTGRAVQIVHEYRDLEIVNRIRERVNEWRRKGYPGVTRTTWELLQYWASPERERKLFFCQLEAAETVIWLTEAPAADRVGIEITSPDPFVRWCLKMATGSGKTVVMAMLIAWSILNKVRDRQNPLFSDAVLVVCPNLTVKGRLQVLYPDREGVDAEESYYSKFDIVPATLRGLLAQGRVLVTNWHAFALQDDTRKHGVVNRGVESDSAFCDRVLSDLGRKGNLLVLNDEAHHAYRFYTGGAGGDELVGEALESDFSEKEEAERARVWIEGLDRIHKVRGIRHCIDLTATPYFLKGSGRIEGEPFDWIVSDFGLLDAIECGIVKVPRIPNWDNSERTEPKYLRLYHQVKGKLPKSEKELTAGGKSVALVEEVQGALTTLADQWVQDRDAWEQAGRPVPPAMIIVCSNTAVSSLLADFIGRQGKVHPDLRNREGDLPTLRIDSKLLKDSEIKGLNQTQEEAAEELREIVRTVGKLGGPGEQIRCIVSVGMLSEGWDAQNVTQILGLRAFSSPLLCEQVIGRGLRRFNYDDMTVPETVDVYGIPFEVLPIAKVGPSARTERRITTVSTVPERQKQHETLFPRVVSYISDVKYRIKVDIDSMPELPVTPTEEPTQTGVTEPWRAGEMPSEYHTRDPFYGRNRVGSALFHVAARVTDSLQNRMLFPQVLRAARRYYDAKVKYSPGVAPEEFCLERYVNQMANNLSAYIRSADDGGGPQKLLPVLDPYRPLGSTNGIFFQTSLYCVRATKSHVSHIACHSKVWERDIAVKLEQNPRVETYVRNYKLGFSIPYDWAGQTHPYEPDFIVRLRRDDGSLLNIVLEVKGMTDNRDRAKEAGARRWVDAVNNWGKLGAWEYLIVEELARLETVLDGLARGRGQATPN